ncbi:MAG: hypothetical protein G01um101448_862 [Parcubacteria group bacterium Gr01-1014_48]|nr:MAG: hypothetical protein Greene041614_1017 [Parcubacteria group bacterium Greene0416_14]TSC73224.1 MAG: hypothetical protein G01um101448_862 [Parcubacteria group bacterium Gr01-1014_48]TSD00487.1 MAG: hypothetical protein Greene101415_836 [Parcubacteria group bacterium Greene1014_15]TSD08378.1 MAG: hypothetical protein Greene07144_94 [Parcubacteria group bacterium Greene0714_4]
MKKYIFIFVVILIIVGVAIYWLQTTQQKVTVRDLAIESTISKIDQFEVGSWPKFKGIVVENHKPRCREPALCGFPFMLVQVGHGEVRVMYKYDENFTIGKGEVVEISGNFERLGHISTFGNKSFYIKSLGTKSNLVMSTVETVGDWPIYRSKAENFEVRYPPNWKTEEGVLAPGVTAITFESPPEGPRGGLLTAHIQVRSAVHNEGLKEEDCPKFFAEYSTRLLGDKEIIIAGVKTQSKSVSTRSPDFDGLEMCIYFTTRGRDFQISGHFSDKFNLLRYTSYFYDATLKTFDLTDNNQ